MHDHVERHPLTTTHLRRDIDTPKAPSTTHHHVITQTRPNGYGPAGLLCVIRQTWPARPGGGGRNPASLSTLQPGFIGGSSTRVPGNAKSPLRTWRRYRGQPCALPVDPPSTSRHIGAIGKLKQPHSHDCMAQFRTTSAPACRTLSIHLQAYRGNGKPFCFSRR